MNIDTDNLSPQDRAKLAAGRFAAQTYCREGMRLGLGSGTTSHFFVRALAELVNEGLDIVGVPTSTATASLARELGVPLADLDELAPLDVCIDGPDEIDRAGNMIKGGGACLLWEKIVARAAHKMVVVADTTKLVAQIGAFPLPIEIVRFGHGTTTSMVAELLRDHGYGTATITPRLRDGERLITDNGNYIIDAHLNSVNSPEILTVELNQLPGVVENGLFVNIGHEVVFGRPDGSAAAFPLPLAGDVAP